MASRDMRPRITAPKRSADLTRDVARAPKTKAGRKDDRVEARPLNKRRHAEAEEDAGATEAFEDAPLYDWEYRRRRADVAFYQMLADEQGGPIADLGCGTGRLLVPLAMDGHPIVGVDRSRPMLLRAAQRIRRHKRTLGSRCLLLQGDLRALPLAGQFPFVLAAFHTIQHLVDDCDLLQLFRSVHTLLTPTGWFAFDIFFPDPDWLARPANRRFDHTVFTHPTTGRKTAYSVSHRMDHARRALHMRIHYQPLGDLNQPAGRARTVRLCHRQLAPDDVAGLLKAAGLRVLSRWAGFQDEPFDEAHPHATEQHVYLVGRMP